MSLISFRIPRTAFAAALLAGAIALATLSPPQALAGEDTIFAPGDPIVTGFSGVLPPGALPPGSDPLDYTLIDPDGPSMTIETLQPDGPPAGQLIDAPSAFVATAKDVGQTFAVALDDAPEITGAAAPNIYLAATSAFGLNIVVPDADGNPMRSRVGAPDATFMPGQWGDAGGTGGYPGSIWKIDGETGEISLFTTIAANSGAALGDIVFDTATQQFFVSDLDTGLIYRLAADGTIVDTFDHGIAGRPEHGLDPVADDGSFVDVTDPAFNTEDPSTWGFTQLERKVNGVAVHGGRLYYAVADGPQIWSVRIQADGSFGAARWELDVADLPSTNEVTSIVFDAQGRMILAQRGPQVGSYDYSVFADPETSSVVRYQHEFPDDPATPGTWVETPKSYAIGFAADGANASGGVTLGYGFDADTGSIGGACNAFVWATGDALRDNPDLDPPGQVSGLQGFGRTLVRPQNDPPALAFFADYDGNTDDDQTAAQGHVGDVAIWQVCEGAAPDFEEPFYLPPPDYAPAEHFNLTLEKWSKPFACFDGGANWWCSYTIRVENTGTVPYWGPVTVHDYLPANNPGASMFFWPQPPWSCGPTGPTAYDCETGPTLLYPGDGVVLHEVVKLPKAMVAYCHLANVAGLQWPFGFGDDDPSDDFGLGVAGIAGPGCVPPGGGSDLQLSKVTFPGTCFNGGVDWICNYLVVVQNAGPGTYTGPITVKDTLGINAPAVTVGPWACGQAGPVLTCNIVAPPVNVPPGWTSGFLVSAHVKKGPGAPLCDLPNKANIASPPGGSPTNLVPGNDFDSATTHIPDPACLVPHPHTDLQAKKTGLGCGPFFGGYLCKWKITVTNVGPDAYAGPLSFKDTATGAVLNTLPSVAPFCAGPTADLTCTPVGPVLLNPGVPQSYTFFTGYTGGPTVCSANNTLTIVNPSPGSAQNPSGNNSATLNQVIPNPACAGLPQLNITKTAKGCASDPSSPDWLCKFDIKVKNFGAVAQPAPIKVKDYNTKPTTFSGAACAPSGAGQWLCTKPAPLAAGATWSFTATTRVDPNGVTLADCNVLNKVVITAPLSADPGHTSQASQKVPQLFINMGPGPVYVYCDPPSLKLEKTAGKTVKSGDGYNSTFTIKATSTGPDPYLGTVELDEVLPDGTSYVSSSWTCVPTIGNDVHCSSPYKNIPVGKYTSMTITIHVPTDVAIGGKCNIVNTVNAAISADVLHSDVGAQYSASAKATIPASVCRAAPACSVNQVKPDGSCCDTGLVWNGKQCASPKPPKCPDDSHLTQSGACVCDKGTEGKPGQCEPIQSAPICPDDSHLTPDGQCACDKGTEGKPGRCQPIDVAPVCPDDSHLNQNDQCVCDKGTEGKPGRCQPIDVSPICPDDSHLTKNGQCACDEGTEGKPGRCQPIEVTPNCPDDSHLAKNGQCVCDRGTEGKPGQCAPVDTPPACARDSHIVDGECVCLDGTHGSPGNCKADIVIQICAFRDSQLINGECVCRPGSHGTPGQCQPDEQPAAKACPDDSHFDKRRNACVCNQPLKGEPGSCSAGINLQLNLKALPLN